MKFMKILQVNKLYSPWVGGVEKIVQQVSEGLSGKKEFEVEVFCCSQKGARKTEEVNGVKVYRAASLGVFWGMPLSFDFFRLFKKLSKEADVIDLHHPFPLGDLALFLFRPKAKIIVHYHSDIVRQKILELLFKPLVVSTLKRAEKIVVSNPNLMRSSPYLNKFQEKCQVIPFGVDLARFARFDEKEVEKIKEKYGKFVLFVGRLNYYKGLEYLIEAMKKVEANLVIIGEGQEEKNLKFQISNLKIDNRVFFLPFQKEDELVNYYRACSVFVLPSIFRSEAFGLVLIEAMACAKPVISTELGTGTSFVNQDGVTGFVVPPKDSRVLAQTIKKILEDKKMTENFGRNARERAEKEFSLDKMLKRTEKVYKEISNF